MTPQQSMTCCGSFKDCSIRPIRSEIRALWAAPRGSDQSASSTAEVIPPMNCACHETVTVLLSLFTRVNLDTSHPQNLSGLPSIFSETDGVEWQEAPQCTCKWFRSHHPAARAKFADHFLIHSVGAVIYPVDLPSSAVHRQQSVKSVKTGGRAHANGHLDNTEVVVTAR